MHIVIVVWSIALVCIVVSLSSYCRWTLKTIYHALWAYALHMYIAWTNIWVNLWNSHYTVGYHKIVCTCTYWQAQAGVYKIACKHLRTLWSTNECLR